MEVEPTTGRSRATRVVLFALGLLLLAGFVALGAWQLERRRWKLDLIERVEARVAAPPIDAPGPALWPRVDAARFEYRHIAVTGRLRHERETFVQASTARGSGWWSMVPLDTGRGWTVLVNRGFVSDEKRASGTLPKRRNVGPLRVTGLLRLGEGSGTWPRRNDPAADRWYTRDVPAIARARGLARVAPYYIDVGGVLGPGPPPVSGMGEVRFRNHHLAYALTWFALAALVAGALALLWRDGRRIGG